MPPTRHRVAVIGAGYVGLPTAAVLSSFGHHVVCAEHDPRKLELLNKGVSPIFEPGLDELLSKGLASKNLSFVSSARAAVEDADVVFLCVPTPRGDDGAVDMSYIEVAARDMAPSLKFRAVVVNKSTVPVGTVQLVSDLLGRRDVDVVSNPEFLREGYAVADSLSPERIVIGSETPAAALLVASLFESTKAPVLMTDTATAETIKYAANAFLATKLSYVNAMAGLCDALGADIDDLVTGLGLDSRIGSKFLSPGPGWGGACLPKDTEALTVIARNAGFSFPLLDEVINTNTEQMSWIIKKIEQSVGSLSGRCVALWGLTFKANTDDRRASPALAIATRLIERGARVRAYDPSVRVGDTSPDLVSLEICSSMYDAASGADLVVVATEWSEFESPDFALLLRGMRRYAVVDVRNVMNAEAVVAAGFSYDSLGRRPVVSPMNVVAGGSTLREGSSLLHPLTEA